MISVRSTLEDFCCFVSLQCYRSVSRGFSQLYVLLGSVRVTSVCSVSIKEQLFKGKKAESEKE